MTTSARDLVNEVKTYLLNLEHQMPAQQIGILISGPFGEYRLVHLTVKAPDLLLITVRRDVNQDAYIIAPTERCAFTFFAVTPEPNEDNRIKIGFGQ